MENNESKPTAEEIESLGTVFKSSLGLGAKMIELFTKERAVVPTVIFACLRMASLGAIKYQPGKVIPKEDFLKLADSMYDLVAKDVEIMTEEFKGDTNHLCAMCKERSRDARPKFCEPCEKIKQALTSEGV